VAEILPAIATAKKDLANLRTYTKPISISTELALAPASSYIVHEPLGVVGIFGSWNFPIFVTLKPLISAICAGNCAILKPSEVGPHSSAMMKKFVETYLD
jgi:acyl-CoA reductase-like NAD-dependent aldehyde dehydrogenase